MIQWQWQWWKPSYWPQRLEATETAAGFKQNSAICLQTFSSQNDSRHPPLAGKILPLQPWQNCLYRWYLTTTQLMHNLSHKVIRGELMQCDVQFWTNILHHALWGLRHIKVNNYIGAIKFTWNTHFSSNDGEPYISVILSLYSSIL